MQGKKQAEKSQLTVEGIHIHNVVNQSLSLSLNQLIGVSGVSGSGKSSIFIDLLATELDNYFKTGHFTYQHCNRIEGIENIRGIKIMTQKGAGRSSRANPITYTKIYDDFRKIYAEKAKDINLSLKASSFSFNSTQGQCANCKGKGYVATKMHFMPDVQVLCPTCKGKRFKDDVLKVKCKGLTIHDLLNLTITQAHELFLAHNKIGKKLHLLEEVGLGYLQLGQEFSTLSGGEMQRIKLARDLIDHTSKDYLYILDEPSAGLHFADTNKLITLFKKIVAQGNTVIVIEHNPDFIATCDHLIELGPKSGQEGGKIIFQGSPTEIIQSPTSPTGQYLKTLI